MVVAKFSFTQPKPQTKARPAYISIDVYNLENIDIYLTIVLLFEMRFIDSLIMWHISKTRKMKSPIKSQAHAAPKQIPDLLELNVPEKKK